MQVRDAETGEWLVIPQEARSFMSVDVDCAPVGFRSRTPMTTSKPATVLPPLDARQNNCVEAEASESNSEPQAHGPKSARVVFPETQSTRAMGSTVDWEQRQLARVERAEQNYRQSLDGMRRELARRDLPADVRQALSVQILEKMKAQYAHQVRLLVVEEMEREMEREVELRMELSSIGKTRLRSKHETQRTFYKAQIERVRSECEMRLVATMTQYNLLR